MDNREAVNWLINISADIGKAEHSDLWHYEQALTEIKNILESAQQEERMEERTETRACDLIGRQEAIDAIHNLYAIHGSEGSWIDQRDAFNAVNNLPSAQLDRKLIDGYMWKIKQNISPHTAAEGVIAIKYYLSQIYEQIYGKGEKPKWMT